MASATLRLAAELSAHGEGFALVTVVWRRGPTSGKEGSRAVITPDGKIHGWLGGACASPSVVGAALEALADGQARLMFLGPSDELDGSHRAGVTIVPMACESEGAMEVHIEPFLPDPMVMIVGRSPAAVLLTRLVQDLSWGAVLVDVGGVPTQEGIVNVRTTLDLSGADDRTFVVVATQGHYDEPALQAALATPAGYVGLIASEKRATSVKESLRAEGMSDETMARVKAPAGVDLGRVAHDEIAVSVLAELVALRAAGGLPGIVAHTPVTAIDPVCGMTVDVADARFTAERAATTYYFCAAGCRRAFETNPHEFLEEPV